MEHKCVDCGKDISLWLRIFLKSKICSDCKKVKKEKIKKYLLKLNIFGADNYLDRQEIESLEMLRKELGLTVEDIKDLKKFIKLIELTKLANILRYYNKLQDFKRSGCISEEQEKEIQALKEQLYLSDKDVTQFSEELAHLKRLTYIKSGNLPVVKNPDIVLKEGELCHLDIVVSLMEERQHTKYVGVTQGMSFRVAKGVSYRIGGFGGTPITTTSDEFTDVGSLHITNKRVVFTGRKKSVTYQLNKIVTYDIDKYSIRFQQENELKPKYFWIDNQYLLEEIDAILRQLFETKKGEELSEKEKVFVEEFDKGLKSLTEYNKINFPAIIGDMVVGIKEGTNEKCRGKVIGTKPDSRYLIRTGKDEWIGIGVIKIEESRIGDKVWGKWDKDGKWYKAILKEIYPDKFILVTKDEPWVATEITCI